jgi:hypothetical protein
MDDPLLVPLPTSTPIPLSILEFGFCSIPHYFLPTEHLRLCTKGAGFKTHTLATDHQKKFILSTWAFPLVMIEWGLRNVFWSSLNAVSTPLKNELYPILGLLLARNLGVSLNVQGGIFWFLFWFPFCQGKKWKSAWVLSEVTLFLFWQPRTPSLCQRAGSRRSVPLWNLELQLEAATRASGAHGPHKPRLLLLFLGCTTSAFVNNERELACSRATPFFIWSPYLQPWCL